MRKVRVLIVNDNLDSVKSIKKALDKYKDIKIIGEAVNGKEAVDIALSFDPDIILMDISMPGMNGFEASQQISSIAPYIGIVLTGTAESIDVVRKAMHTGAGDFLELPLNSEKIYKAIMSLYEVKKDQRNHFVDSQFSYPKRQPQVISVFSSKGGVGKSVISINAAIVAREQTRGDVLLVDMDLQFGDIAVMLNIKPAISIIDMISAKKNIDMSELEKYVITHSSGIKVLPAPQQPEQAEMVAINDVQDIIGLFKKTFDFIIIDLPPLFNDNTVTSIEMSDYVFLVTTMEIPSLKNVKSGLDVLYSLGCSKEKIILVVNRYHESSEISIDDIKKFVGIQRIVCIDDCPQFVSSSINLGEPLVIRYRDKPISRQIFTLTRQIIDYSIKSSSKNKKSLLSRLKSKLKGGSGNNE